MDRYEYYEEMNGHDIPWNMTFRGGFPHFGMMCFPGNMSGGKMGIAAKRIVTQVADIMDTKIENLDPYTAVLDTLDEKPRAEVNRLAAIIDPKLEELHALRLERDGMKEPPSELHNKLEDTKTSVGNLLKEVSKSVATINVGRVVNKHLRVQWFDIRDVKIRVGNGTLDGKLVMSTTQQLFNQSVFRCVNDSFDNRIYRLISCYMDPVFEWVEDKILSDEPIHPDDLSIKVKDAFVIAEKTFISEIEDDIAKEKKDNAQD